MREKGAPGSTSTTLSNIYVNAFDFWNGYLRLDNDGNRINSYDQNDNLVLFRDMPAGLNVNGAWAAEAFVSLDLVNIISVSGMSACLSINNLANYGGLGNAEIYLCVSNGNAAGSPYTISFEQGQGKWSAYYGTQTLPGNPFAGECPRPNSNPTLTPRPRTPQTHPNRNPNATRAPPNQMTQPTCASSATRASRRRRGAGSSSSTRPTPGAASSRSARTF